MRINTLRIVRYSKAIVIGEIEVAKIDKLLKKCRDTFKRNIQLCGEHSTFVVTIYVPSVNKESI